MKTIEKEYYNLINVFGKENIYNYLGSSLSYKRIREKESFNDIYIDCENYFIENNMLPYWLIRDKYKRDNIF
jgi:hypothetical protein